MIGDTSQRGYALCTVPRTGSNYLCRLLDSTGVLGTAREYFNTQGRRDNGYPDYPDDPEDQLGWVVREGATPNGVYGVKVFPDHFDHSASTRWTSRLPNLSFIHLERRDLLGQALSLARARQTSQYSSVAEPRAEPRYDRQHITDCLAEIVRGRMRWDFYFARNGLTPLRLVYEDFVGQPLETVGRVARLVGLSGQITVDFAKVAHRIQRDALTETWRRRFLAESFDLTVLH